MGLIKCLADDSRPQKLLTLSRHNLGPFSSLVVSSLLFFLFLSLSLVLASIDVHTTPTRRWIRVVGKKRNPWRT